MTFRKLATIRNPNKKEVTPKILLDLVLAHNFNFHDLHSREREFNYTNIDQHKLMSLLLFFEVSQFEDDIEQWPQELPPLPPPVKNNWKNFCRQFHQRGSSTHTWKDGPSDLDKHIGVAKDLVSPASFGATDLRNIARVIYKYHNEDKNDNESSLPSKKQRNKNKGNKSSSKNQRSHGPPSHHWKP